MSRAATEVEDSSPGGLADRLASDGFVLLHKLCGSAMVRSMLDVSRRRARAVREALGTREIGIGSAAG